MSRPILRHNFIAKYSALVNRLDKYAMNYWLFAQTEDRQGKKNATVARRIVRETLRDLEALMKRPIQ